MKLTILIGVVLIIAGVAALAWQGFTYTDTEQVAKLGPLEITAQQEKTVPIPPWVSYGTIGAGLLLVVAGALRK